MSFENGTLLAATALSAFALFIMRYDGDPGFLIGAAGFWIVYIRGAD